MVDIGSQAAPSLRRDLIIGLSFANLSFFKVWSTLLTYTGKDTYLIKSGVEPFAIYACITNVLLLGLALGVLAYTLQMRLKWSRFKHWLFLSSLILPLNALRAVAVERFPGLRLTALTQTLGLKIVFLLACAALVLLALLRGLLVRNIPLILLLLVAFVPLNIARGFMVAAAYDPAVFQDKPLAAKLADARKGPRIVWAIFDEWDYRLTFRERDPSIQMPEVDRFRDTALSAANAYPPSSQTAWSLPAVTTGILVSQARVLGPDDLLLRPPAPGAPVRWRDAPNTFAEAHAAGYNVGVAGFYHPYCRLFNDSLSACSWWPTALEYNSLGGSYWEVLGNQWRSLFETDSRSLFGQALAVRRHGEIQQVSLAASLALARDPTMGVVFLHVPIPHAPYAYDRRTGQFNGHSPRNDYWDNLVLLDRFVGELRAAMEAAGLWDSSVVLLSADHWNRASVLLDGKIDHRIPFLLKMPGQHQGLSIDRPFNTVLSHDLVQACLRGEITDARGAAEWLERHCSIGDSPYNTDFIP